MKGAPERRPVDEYHRDLAQAILEACKTLIREGEADDITIRKVAARLQIAPGSIYHYYASRNDLLSRTVESIWREIFQGYEVEHSWADFGSCLNWMQTCLQEAETRYPGFLKLHARLLADSRQQDRQRMLQSWERLKAILLRALQEDPRISPKVFSKALTPEEFTDAVFSLMLASVQTHLVTRESIRHLCDQVLG